MKIKDLWRYRWYVDEDNRLVVYLGVGTLSRFYEDRPVKAHRYLISGKDLYDYWLTRKDCAHHSSCFVTDSGIIVYGVRYIPPRSERFNQRLTTLDGRSFTAFLSGSIFDTPNTFIINKGGAKVIDD